MTTQPADGSDLIDRLVRYGLGHSASRSRALPPNEAIGRQEAFAGVEAVTDHAGEAVPGDDCQVRFPRPG